MTGDQSANYAAFINSMSNDERITATHLSLLSALFVCWQINGGVKPFQVCRRKLMFLSKIASTATYHKCIKQLHSYGYIRYQSSYHPVKGSLVYWPIMKYSEQVQGD
jgi:hypothetical protein